MDPLGFYSVCLKTGDLGADVDYYRRLGFKPVGEDAPGLRVSLAYGDDSLTFMSFLDDNLINFRGAHIHQLKSQLETAGVAVKGYNELADQQPLMLDEHGEPLPDNECGHFTVHDPDGHELFFNTHPPEREPFEAALVEVKPREAHEPTRSLLGQLIYCLEVTDLHRSIEFYETLGLTGARDTRGAWIAPPTHHRSVHFAFRLREESTAGSLLTFHGANGTDDQFQTLGFVRNKAGWTGVDPDGRRLELLSNSEIPPY